MSFISRKECTNWFRLIVLLAASSVIRCESERAPESRHYAQTLLPLSDLLRKAAYMRADQLGVALETSALNDGLCTSTDDPGCGDRGQLLRKYTPP